MRYVGYYPLVLVVVVVVVVVVVSTSSMYCVKLLLVLIQYEYYCYDKHFRHMLISSFLLTSKNGSSHLRNLMNEQVSDCTLSIP